MSCSLRELYQRFEGWEIDLFFGYFGIEGWPEDRADYRSAMIAQTVASTVGARTKLKDFIPQFDDPPKQSWEVTKAQFAAVAAYQKGRKQRGK